MSDAAPDLYCRPVFDRGQGLGNRLFAWGRCRVFAHRTGARMAAPLWFRPAVGPLLRGGTALRHYRRQFLLLGLFRRVPGDLTWIEGVRLGRRCRVLAEPDDLSRRPDPAAGRATLVEFRGYRDFFARLEGCEGLLLESLRAMTRPEHVRRAEALGDVPVAINVRIGNDFRAAPAGEAIRPGDKTPLAWFVRALHLVREAAGRPVPAVVVSDGTPESLADLLAVQGVTLLRPGCAASDLLVLARARVLLASGSSSFGAWGAFLGRMPVASHPAQPMSEWRIRPSRGQFVGTLDVGAPDPAFLRQASEALGAP